jgi:DMSO/TMAO reductase YedYZ molybdopterin-dependent catalytic subunit
LVSLSTEPVVSETTDDRLRLACTPTDAFYIRNHFDVPIVDRSSWSLTVEGATRREWSFDEVRDMPSRTLVVTMECAGNGRSFFSKPTDGVRFTQGGVSTAEWRGVALRDVLNQVGIADGASPASSSASSIASSGRPKGSIRSRSIACA